MRPRPAAAMNMMEAHAGADPSANAVVMATGGAVVFMRRQYQRRHRNRRRQAGDGAEPRRSAA